MILLTPELRFALRANDIARRACDANGERFDPPPVVKLFNPVGAATWLATELGEDGDTLFGLADLGFGCPELGQFSLSEIAAVRLPYGLFIERDLSFDTGFSLTVWTEWARRAGSILWAETLLRRAAQSGSTPGAAPSREATAHTGRCRAPLRVRFPKGSFANPLFTSREVFKVCSIRARRLRRSSWNIRVQSASIGTRCSITASPETCNRCWMSSSISKPTGWQCSKAHLLKSW